MHAQWLQNREREGRIRPRNSRLSGTALVLSRPGCEPEWTLLFLVVAVHAKKAPKRGPMKILSALAVKEVVEPAAQAFTQETGETFETFFAPVGTLASKISDGATGDIAILIPAALEKLQQQNILTGRFDLGQVGIGVGIKAGAGKPDLSTPEAFKQALLNARSIALTDPAVGATAGIYLAGLFERMGITETVRPKVLWQQNGFDGALAVAEGAAEIGLTQISELVGVKGVEVAGPLPLPLQLVTTYCAGIFTASKAQDSARAFIDKLLSPALHARWKAAGFELPSEAP
jgi:molybdate transport system substrate-binding protein